MKINNKIIGMRNLNNMLRCLIFTLFFILSLRSVLVYLNYLTGSVQLIGILAVLIGFGFCWWKTIWVLYAFVISIPIISGLQELGFMKFAPVISFLFSIIYISWFSKFFLWEKKRIVSLNIISNLIDVLAGVVYLSLIACLAAYPLSYSLYRLQYASIMGQADPFWFMEAGFIVLQGMFLYRIFELEGTDKKQWGGIFPCLYCHVVIIFFFASWEIFRKITAQNTLLPIFSPFQDLHSYGGYLLILLGFFVYPVFKNRKFKIEILFILPLLILIFLSESSAAVISLLLVGSVWAVVFFTKRKKVVFLSSFIICTMFFVYSLPESIPQNKYAGKYASRMNFSTVLELKTVLERFELWGQASEIIKEFPLTGSGIGSFYKISNNYSKNTVHSGELRNAHNYYFQFAAELGIPALILFLLILFFVFRAGIQPGSSVQSKGLLIGVSAYLLSMISGHHLILSVQQVLFWFVLFAVVSSAPELPNRNEHSKESKYLSPILFALVFLVIAGHAFNLFYLKKEVKGIYEYGLYKPQMIDTMEMRWSDLESRRKIYAETDYFGFSMYAKPENFSPGILEMEIYANDKLVDRVTWEKKGILYRAYHLPGIKGRSLILRTHLSGTYNPYKKGLSRRIGDNREQGVAISEITFFSKEQFNQKKNDL